MVVSRVVDGDTFVTGDGERVRLLGIDAPEMNDGRAEVRDLARAARSRLTALVEGRAVHLLVGTPPRDRYGRLLAYAHGAPSTAEPPAALGSDVGAELLSSGHAQLYPTLHPRLDEYRRRARLAREQGAGLWTSAGRRALRLDVVADVPTSRAGEHLGQRARITGHVVRARRTDDGVFLDLSAASDGAPELAAVVFAAQLPLFPSDVEERWRGRRLAVTGLVERYRGRPQVILRLPEQVELLP